MAIFDVSKTSNSKDRVLLKENFMPLDGILLNKTEYKEFRRDLQEAIDPDEGYGNILRPVFIVVVNQGNLFSKAGEAIRKFAPGRDGSKEKYWHASMSFGPNLKHLYSFSSGHEIAGNNKYKGGLSFESIEYYKKWYAPDATMQVSCILLAKENFNKVRETLNYYFMNKEKTSYHTTGLIDIFFHKGQADKMRLSNICSQFVDSVLRNSGIHISKRLNNLTSPTDLSAAEGDRKQFIVYDGLIREYDEKAVIEKVDAMSRKKSNEYFKLLEKEKKEEEKNKKKEEKDDNK